MTQLKTEETDILSQRIIDKVTTTEYRLIEKKLVDIERCYCLLSENMTDIIWATDMNLCFTYVSPSVTRILGFSVEEAMTLPIEKAFTPCSAEAVLQSCLEELTKEKMGQSRQGRWTLMLEQYRKDGSTIWVESEITVLRDHNNQPAGILGVTHDATRQKQAEEEVKRYAEIFQSKNREFDMASEKLSSLSSVSGSRTLP